jgi:hypothetical protein
VWHEFFLNGVKWKGRTIPRLPILQPEKVTTTGTARWSPASAGNA